MNSTVATGFIRSFPSPGGGGESGAVVEPAEGRRGGGSLEPAGEEEARAGMEEHLRGPRNGGPACWRMRMVRAADQSQPMMVRAADQSHPMMVRAADQTQPMSFDQ